MRQIVVYLNSNLNNANGSSFLPCQASEDKVAEGVIATVSHV